MCTALYNCYAPESGLESYIQKPFRNWLPNQERTSCSRVRSNPTPDPCLLPLRFAKFKSTQEYSLESHHLNVLHSGPEWIAYIVGILPKLEEHSRNPRYHCREAGAYSRNRSWPIFDNQIIPTTTTAYKLQACTICYILRWAQPAGSYINWGSWNCKLQRMLYSIF